MEKEPKKEIVEEGPKKRWAYMPENHWLALLAFFCLLIGFVTGYPAEGVAAATPFLAAGNFGSNGK